MGPLTRTIRELLTSGAPQPLGCDREREVLYMNKAKVRKREGEGKAYYNNAFLNEVVLLNLGSLKARNQRELRGVRRFAFVKGAQA
jgi:hypothetical protein